MGVARCALRVGGGRILSTKERDKVTRADVERETEENLTPDADHKKETDNCFRSKKRN